MTSQRALLVDFGGVLTTNVFESFREFCEREGLDPNAFLDLFRSDEEARRDLRRLETGKIDEDEFATVIGPQARARGDRRLHRPAVRGHDARR